MNNSSISPQNIKDDEEKKRFGFWGTLRLSRKLLLAFGAMFVFAVIIAVVTLNGLNRTQAAYEKTTTLSANLIDCAARGLANERLINTLDWILTGEPGEANVIANLLGWGNSSGVDAFTGMAAAIKSSSPEF